MTPSSKETGNVKACHSGHCSTCGINVQGVCDSSCRFTCAAVVTPGSFNDCRAYKESDLPALADALPTGACAIGFNAHLVSEKLLMPFSGAEAHEELKSNYIFFLSQCRIRIEMAFGRLINKWRILKTPLHVRLKNARKVFMACALLHNFCINEGEHIPIVEPSQMEQYTAECLNSDRSATRQSGTSCTRDNLANEVADGHLGGPPSNSQRNDSQQNDLQRKDNANCQIDSFASDIPSDTPSLLTLSDRLSKQLHDCRFARNASSSALCDINIASSSSSNSADASVAKSIA